MFEMISKREVSCHLSTVTANYSWIYNGRDYVTVQNTVTKGVFFKEKVQGKIYDNYFPTNISVYVIRIA
jgi:hypothetical protein